MGENLGLQSTAGAQGSPVPQRTPADMEAQRNKMLQMLAGAKANAGAAGAPGAPPAAPAGAPMPGGMPAVPAGQQAQAGGMAGMVGRMPRPGGAGGAGGAGGVPNSKCMGGPGGRTTNMLMGLKQRPMANPAAGISAPGAGLIPGLA
jgi:hypothetical protein